jgi:hypothetical protein
LFVHRDEPTKKGNKLMRNLLIAGTAGLFLTLGAANAYAVPANSPYATMVPPGLVDGATAPDNSMDYMGSDPNLVEGRSAYIDPDYAYDDSGYDDYGPQYYGPMGGGFYGGYGGGRGGHFGGGHFGGGHFGGGHFGGGHSGGGRF